MFCLKLMNHENGPQNRVNHDRKIGIIIFVVEHNHVMNLNTIELCCQDSTLNFYKVEFCDIMQLYIYQGRGD